VFEELGRQLSAVLVGVARSRTDAVFDDTARFGDAVHRENDRAQMASEFLNSLLT